LGGGVISDCLNNSGKRSGVDHHDNHLGVSTTMKMKKTKGRKKERKWESLGFASRHWVLMWMCWMMVTNGGSLDKKL